MAAGVWPYVAANWAGVMKWRNDGLDGSDTAETATSIAEASRTARAIVTVFESLGDATPRSVTRGWMSLAVAAAAEIETVLRARAAAIDNSERPIGARSPPRFCWFMKSKLPIKRQGSGLAAGWGNCFAAVDGRHRLSLRLRATGLEGPRWKITKRSLTMKDQTRMASMSLPRQIDAICQWRLVNDSEYRKKRAVNEITVPSKRGVGWRCEGIPQAAFSPTPQGPCRADGRCPARVDRRGAQVHVRVRDPAAGAPNKRGRARDADVGPSAGTATLRRRPFDEAMRARRGLTGREPHIYTRCMTTIDLA